MQLLIIPKIPMSKYIFHKVNFNLLLKFIRWIITKNILNIKQNIFI